MSNPPPPSNPPNPSTASNPPPPPRSTRRGPAPVAWIAIAVVAVLAVAGTVWFLRDGSSGQVAGTASGTTGGAPVTLEPYGPAGDDPFVQSTEVVAISDYLELVSVQPVPVTADPASGTQLVGGGTPLLYGSSPAGNTALYGGSNEQSVCDPAALVDFLSANPDKATAWAGVFGLTADEVPAFVRRLTPIVLLRDTAVTNHGFTGGQAVPRQAVLQAGTAVMVDEFGVPAVRCACGNPLLPPDVVDLPAAEFRGERWAGFNPDQVFAVTAAASVLTTFTVLDVVSGQPLELRSGAVNETLAAIGEAGVALSDDGVTWHPVAWSPAGTQIAAGGGTALAIQTSAPPAPPASTVLASTDGGLTWTPVTAAPANATFVAFDAGRWLLLTEPDLYDISFNDPPELKATVHASTDLATWTAHEINVPLEPLPSSGPGNSSYTDIVSFGAGDGRTAIGVLLAQAEGANRQYLLSSADLATWQKTSWADGSVVHPTVAWDGASWGMTAFRYDGALRDGNSHGLAGPAAADLSSATLAPTNDDVGLGSLDHSAGAGWIAAGWRGADWQDPALYTSTDLATWTRVADLPGHGFDVAAVTVGVDLTGLPTLPTPVAVTGSGCPPVDGEQAIVTKGQMTCAAIARVGFDDAGPYTGGQHVAPKWHHWGCDWYVIPEIEAGRWPSLSCSENGQRHVVEFWAVDKAPTAPSGTPTEPDPGSGAGDTCVQTHPRYGTLTYTVQGGELTCADMVAVLDTYMDGIANGSSDPNPAGWRCYIPSAEDIDWGCASDSAGFNAFPAGDAPAGGGSGGSGSGGGESGSTDGEISVSKPMATPACDGTPIVIYASAVTPGRYSADIQAALDAHPGASWVRTDRSCSSFAQATGAGGPIYAVYQAFPSVSAACAEVAAVGDSVGRRFLDNGSPSTSVYSCP